MAVFAVRSLEHAAALGTAVDGPLRLTINEETTEVDYLIAAVRGAVGVPAEHVPGVSGSGELQNTPSR